MKFSEEFFKSINITISKIDTLSISKSINILKKLRGGKGRLFIIGVGGSAGNASHAVNDFRKLCNIDAYSPVDNISEITARTNDEGFETIFDAYLKLSKFDKNDVLMVFSVDMTNGIINPHRDHLIPIDLHHKNYLHSIQRQFVALS